MKIKVPGHNNLDYSNNTQEELNEYFIAMCKLQNLDKIKYILESPKFNGVIRPEIHIGNDTGFKWLMRRESTEIIDYLIFQYNIEKTRDIEAMLSVENNDYAKIIKDKFDLREINKSLNSELPHNEVKAKRNKV